MNLWLIPASDDASLANIPKSLSAPISIERAGKAGVVANRHAWGAKASSEMNISKFNKMTSGDWCLFYTQGLRGGNKKYHWKAQITDTTRSRTLSEALWDDADFELVYFLGNVQEVDITTEQLSTGFSEFRPNYFNEAPKGFTAVDPEVVAGISDKYGSLDDWLSRMHTAIRFWVEKTIVKNRPDRQMGENALGRVLWSPQRAEDGKDIYRQMREVKPGDVVFHFVDNEVLASFSVAGARADETFVGVEGTAWAGRPAYRIPLKQHQEIAPPIDRHAFLQDPRYRTLIEELLEIETGLFFNREFNLNQGSYLTAAPLKLVQIWNDIHLRTTGRPICESWNIPPLAMTQPPISKDPMLVFDSVALRQAFEAVGATNFRIGRDFLNRFVGSLVAKPFVILTGNSGTGKTKLAELFARWLCEMDSDRFALVSVGADWTDNRNVLGFVNHLRPTEAKDGVVELELPVYQTTKILDLLLEAGRKENEKKPFVLILDEMNLSHVERYFADFLSAMETKEGGLLLHREGHSLPRSPDGPCDVPETLFLPRNVFVIGTVNVDETTYMFSPKVLDRANVIEFRVGTDVPLGFLKSGGRTIGEIAHAAAGYAEGFLEVSFRARSIKGTALALVANPDLPPDDAKFGVDKCHTTIADLFTLMQKRHQEFAFRSMAEILRFLAVTYELKPATEAWNWGDAMDAQILQKVLPKLHGSKRKIGSLLAALAKYCEQGNRTDAESLLMDETKAEAYLAAEDKRVKAPQFKESYLKLCEMMEAVRRDQFVSFIQ